MPICTSCTHPVPYLYTVYNTANNLRLEQCTACHAFADPYVEHDTLTLLLDLILLKRDVYRHLLFNRGAGVRRLGAQSVVTDVDSEENDSVSKKSAHEQSRERARWMHILKLGAVLIIVDAFIRWSHLGASQPFNLSRIDLLTWNVDAIEGFLRIAAGCFIETLAFHAGVTAASYIVLSSLDWALRKLYLSDDGSVPISGIRQEFRYSHISLTLFYSSLTKLFLLFLLTVWRPTAQSSADSVRSLAPEYNASNMFTNPLILRAIELLDEDKMDREWIVRNVLGGMAAGFGLRDCHPGFTTLVVLTGWAVKTAIANVVSRWVNVNMGVDKEVMGEMWLAYSIP